MAFCKKCGAEFTDDAKFCPVCGERVGDVVKISPKPVLATGESKFTGGAFANFFSVVLVAVISLITLSIAYPFMMCWRKRWVARHTFINGKRLTFDGHGSQLIGKFLLWVLLSIVTVGLYLIFGMPLAMTKWTVKHTHFEGAEKGESKFDGHIWQLFGVNLLTRFVTLITAGLASFWAHCYKERWYAKHTYYDGCRMQFDGKGWQYFGKRIVWLLLTLVTAGIYSFWLVVKTKQWTVKHTHAANMEDIPETLAVEEVAAASAEGSSFWKKHNFGVICLFLSLLAIVAVGVMFVYRLTAERALSPMMRTYFGIAPIWLAAISLFCAFMCCKKKGKGDRNLIFSAVVLAVEAVALGIIGILLPF